MLRIKLRALQMMDPHRNYKVSGFREEQHAEATATLTLPRTGLHLDA